jgi:arylsulfatase A-like enzyme
MKPVLLIGTALVVLMFSSCTFVPSDDPLPNVVIIFIDDEGYGDVGCFGATGYDTPNLDRMASQGMMFTNYYSGSAVCTASRAALMTGCYPPRIGMTGVLFPYHNRGINQEETTIAELLKQKDYATAAVGKWHLGCQEEFLPLQHGFDEYFGLPYSNDMWPVHYNGLPVTEENHLKRWKLTCPPLPLIEGNEKIEEISTLGDMDMLTTRYTERAVDFIKRNQENPFFLYVPHTMAHVPLGVSDKFRGKSEQGFYGDVMMEIDWSVSEILGALKECGIEDNTLVIFTTDNGPWLNYGNHAGSAGGLREGKGTPFEGGFRVPCIMKWPEVIPAGTVCNQIGSSIDILPTIAEIAGTGLPERKIDGISLLPLLKGDFQNAPRNQYYFYSGKALNAVRRDNWKFVFQHTQNTNVGSVVGKDGWPGQMVQREFEGGLFNMWRDPGEQYDMTEVYPEIAEELKDLANQMRKELGDTRMEIEGSENRPPGLVSTD